MFAVVLLLAGAVAFLVVREELMNPIEIVEVDLHILAAN